MKSTNGITRTAPAYEFPAISKRLTLAEQAALEVCESRIEDGLQKFDQVWDALWEIREKALYREHYPSFEEYCRQKWNFGARRGRQLSDAAIVMKALKAPDSGYHLDGEAMKEDLDRRAQNEPVNFPPNGASHRESPTRTGHHEEGNGTQLAGPARTLPTTEKQVRPLTRLKSADEQREAWQEAVAVAGPDKAPSAREVAAVVQKRLKPAELEPVNETKTIAKEGLTCLREIDETLSRNRATDTATWDRFGQARYFAQCIRTELERIVKEEARKETKNGEVPVFYVFRQHRPSGFLYWAGSAGWVKKLASAKFYTMEAVHKACVKGTIVPLKDAQKLAGQFAIEGFLVCRPPHPQQIKQQPRYGRGWGTDPRKATLYGSTEYAEQRAKPGETVVRLMDALIAFEEGKL